jgi:hypothetical protein
MTISEQSATVPAEWDAESLPGDGFIACGSHHIVVIEMDDDDPFSNGIVDDVIAAHDAHSRLLGRGAALSFRQSVDAVLAAHNGARPAVAVLSFWDDKAAISLYGRAAATLHSPLTTTTFEGQGALLATDVVVEAAFDALELTVGEPPEPDVTPLSIGQIATGRGVRLVRAISTPGDTHQGEQPLNEWAKPGERRPESDQLTPIEDARRSSGRFDRTWGLERTGTAAGANARHVRV